jgi:hypothetical protein
MLPSGHLGAEDITRPILTGLHIPVGWMFNGLVSVDSISFCIIKTSFPALDTSVFHNGCFFLSAFIPRTEMFCRIRKANIYFAVLSHVDRNLCAFHLVGLRNATTDLETLR